MEMGKLDFYLTSCTKFQMDQSLAHPKYFFQGPDPGPSAKGPQATAEAESWLALLGET